MSEWLGITANGAENGLQRASARSNPGKSTLYIAV
jgi:hypothetical protein